MTLPDTGTIPISSDLAQMVTRAREASEFLKTLSNETRLLILCSLSEGEKSVTELEAFVGQPQSSVSQHLARLRLDNMVTTRRDGKTIFYSLASDEARTILSTLYAMFCRPGSRANTPPENAAEA